MCRGNVDAGVLSASEPPPPHPSPIFLIALSPLPLLILGFVAIDLGSETNGFWFLGQESLPDKVVEEKYMAQSWALNSHWLSQSLTSAPKSGPMEMEDQEIFCLRTLAQKWDRPRWWSVGAERDSLWGFCPRSPLC